MYTGRKIKIYIFFIFSWKYLLLFLCLSSAVYFLHTILNFKFLEISFLPIGLIGTAVAFYIGFKNNAAYDRLWEARKIWGRLTNYSRTWGITVLDFIREDKLQVFSNQEIKKIKKELVYRHIGFLYALKNQLMSKTVWEEMTGNKLIKDIDVFKTKALDIELEEFISQEEINFISKLKNPALHILRKQSERLKEITKHGLINEFHHLHMTNLLTEIINEQGGCERLKSFPLPRQYAFFCQVFVWIFIFLLPYGIIGEFHRLNAQFTWLMIPFYILIAWVFITMEMIGDNSENPFENSLNDIPMSAICRNIEIDLREMLEEKQIPQKLQSINNILM